MNKITMNTENKYFDEYHSGEYLRLDKDGDQSNFYVSRNIDVSYPIDKSTLNAKLEFITGQAKFTGIDLFISTGLVMNGNNILILIRSTTDDHAPGSPDLPGGGVETGETALEGLYREMKEEMGSTNFDVYDVVGYFDIYYRGRVSRQINFLLGTKDQNVKVNPEEHSSFIWEDISRIDTAIYGFHSKGEQLMVSYFQELFLR